MPPPYGGLVYLWLTRTGVVPGGNAPAARIAFAGEHPATGARGIEGALQSSERAAIEILP